MSLQNNHNLTDYSIMSDEELAEAAKHDSAALSALFVRFLPMLRKIAADTNADAEYAKDLVSEGIIGIMRSLSAYDRSKGRVSTFLYVCSRNQMYSALKSEKFHESIEELDEQELAAAALMYDSAQFSEEDFESVSQLMEDCLTDFERQALVYTYMDNMKCSEAAAKLGKSEKSVENAIYRAKLKIREKLGIR